MPPTVQCPKHPAGTGQTGSSARQGAQDPQHLPQALPVLLSTSNSTSSGDSTFPPSNSLSSQHTAVSQLVPVPLPKGHRQSLPGGQSIQGEHSCPGWRGTGARGCLLCLPGAAQGRKGRSSGAVGRARHRWGCNTGTRCRPVLIHVHGTHSVPGHCKGREGRSQHQGGDQGWLICPGSRARGG